MYNVTYFSDHVALVVVKKMRKIRSTIIYSFMNSKEIFHI